MTQSFDDSILKYFSSLEDPRIERTKQHLLVDIVAIAILAVISGADSWVAIETYAQAKLEWLQQFLTLPNGIPSHDTIARVFAKLDSQAFEQCFQRWVESITETMGAQVIPIDGKTVRQSFDRERSQKAIHVVSAWASTHRLVLGQLKVDDKTNEITAIPKLLELLSIAGCIITIDAMGCQKEIATKIIDKKADYVLALKGNQGKLSEEVSRWFEKARSNDFEGIEHSYHQTTEGAHGRIEIRQYWVESRGAITLRPSLLDPDVIVSSHPAPDVLSLSFCSCGGSRDSFHGWLGGFLSSSYCGYHLRGVDAPFHPS